MCGAGVKAALKAGALSGGEDALRCFTRPGWQGVPSGHLPSSCSTVQREAEEREETLRLSAELRGTRTRVAVQRGLVLVPLTDLVQSLV